MGDKLIAMSNGRQSVIASRYADDVVAPVFANMVHPSSSALSSAWYVAGSLQFGNSIGMTASLSANRMYGHIHSFNQSVTLDRLGCKVSTAGSGNGRLGIYALNANLEPDSLVLDAGEISIGTTGVKTLAISQALPPGVYCFAALMSSAVTMNAIAAVNCQMAYSYDDTLVAGRNNSQAVQTYGALPSAFGSPSFTSMATFIMFRRSQ